MYLNPPKPFILAVLFSAILWSFITPAMAEENNRYITVTGKGEVSAVPDTAWISSGVNTRADTAAQALEENNSLMEQVIEVFLDADVDEKNIQTSGFNVHPVYDYSRDARPPKLIGYDVSNSVTVKLTDISKLGQLLDDMVSSGSNQVSGIRFGFDDDESLLDEARQNAIGHAQKKAQLYAEATGAEVGDVINISEVSVSMPEPIYHRAELAQSRMMDSASASVPVMSGEQEISASVNVMFELDN